MLSALFHGCFACLPPGVPSSDALIDPFESPRVLSECRRLFLAPSPGKRFQIMALPEQRLLPCECRPVDRFSEHERIANLDLYRDGESTADPMPPRACTKKLHVREETISQVGRAHCLILGISFSRPDLGRIDSGSIAPRPSGASFRCVQFFLAGPSCLNVLGQEGRVGCDDGAKPQA